MADEVKPEVDVAAESHAEETAKPEPEGEGASGEQEQGPASGEAEPEVKQEPPVEEKKDGEEVAAEGAQEHVEEQAQGEQEPPVEAPQEPEAPRIKPEAYARVLRRSKTRREEIERLNREKAALEARQKELEAEREAAELGKRINAARESGDLTALLDNLGLDVQTINEAFVKNEGKIPVAKPKPEKMLEALVEKKLAEREAAAKAQHDAQMAQARARSIERVAANPAASVLVKLNYAGEVFDYQAAVYEKTGVVPSEDDAIAHVVKFVRETVLGEEPKPEKKPEPKPAAKAAPVKPAAKPTVRTLSSASAPSSAGAKKPRTDAEIEADTIAFLKDFQAGKATG